MSIQNVFVRPFAPDGSEQVSKVIVRCLKAVNSRDYTPGQIDRLCAAFTPGRVLERFGNRVRLVAVQKGALVSTAMLQDNEVGSVFVCPDFHGRGVGKTLVEHIEAVARQNGVGLIKAYSSLTAVGFYLYLGYEKLREKRELDGEVTIEVEKRLL